MKLGKTENNLLTNIENNDSMNKITATRKQRYNVPSSNQPDVITLKDLKGKCCRWGKIDHRANECKHTNNICKSCNRRGHLRKVCMQRNLHNNEINLKIPA